MRVQTNCQIEKVIFVQKAITIGFCQALTSSSHTHTHTLFHGLSSLHMYSIPQHIQRPDASSSVGWLIIATLFRLCEKLGHR